MRNSASAAQNCGISAKPTRGKPFIKGHDARRNVGGRPRMSDDVRIALSGLWPYALDELRRIITADVPAESDAQLKMFGIKLKAAELILNRYCGPVSEGGAVQDIARATVETDEIQTVNDILSDMGYKKVPDTELQAAAIDATRAAIDDLTTRNANAESASDLPAAGD